MKVWFYMALGLALLALASYRQFFDLNVAFEQRLACEALVRADHDANPRALQELLPRCSRSAMVALMEARREGADAQTPEEVLNATARQEALSALINLALTGAGIGAFAAAWRRAVRDNRRLQGQMHRGPARRIRRRGGGKGR